MTRRILSVSLVLLALGALPGSADAQVRPGIHVARAADFSGGANGVGASLLLSFPLMPVEVMVGGEYFFPDCTGDCGLWGGSADVHLKMPFPILSPYATAGLVWRKSTVQDLDVVSTVGNQGFELGAGVNLGTLVLGAYAEARYEFVDPDNQWVVRVGVRF